jgi:chromosome partitioning protein
MHSQIIAIVNQKGGVGKTTTATSLATAFAATGHRTLLIDLDPQGNASTGFGVSPEQRQISMYDVMVQHVPLIDALLPTIVPKLDIVPATMELAGADIELHKVDYKEFVLKKALAPLMSHYDYVCIDCPPSLSLLTVNALTAATGMLIPMQCEFYALEGLAHLLNTSNLIMERTNPALTIMGIILTMVDRRNKLTRQVEQDVREHLGELVYNTVIPRNVRVSEAPSHGKPVLMYDINCIGSHAYMQLAREILHQPTRQAA